MLRKPLARDVPAPFLPAVHSPQAPIWRPRSDKHCLVQPRTEVLGQTRLTVQLQCWHSRWSDSRCPWQAALCKDQVNRKVGQVAVANSPPEGQQAEQTSDDSKLWLMEAAIAGRLFRSISYWQHSSTEHVVGTDMCAVIYMSCIPTLYTAVTSLLTVSTMSPLRTITIRCHHSAGIFVIRFLISPHICFKLPHRAAMFRFLSPFASDWCCCAQCRLYMASYCYNCMNGTVNVYLYIMHSLNGFDRCI